MSRNGGRGRNKGFDDEFEAFMKESFSSEDSSKINRFFEPKAKKKTNSKLWWDQEDDDDEIGTGTVKSFLKKSTDSGATGKRSEAKEVKTPTKANKDVKPRGKTEASISKDSLDDISEKSEEDHGDRYRPKVHLPEESIDSLDTEELLRGRHDETRVGMDTLDELADKEKFFRDLENNADGTVDYGRLNQELSATGNTLSPEAYARTGATLAPVLDIEDEEENWEPRPNTRGDNLYSEREHSEQKPSMLSKVSLMDSLESTMNTTTSPQVGRDTLRAAKDILDERDEDYLHDQPTGNFRPGLSGPETLKTVTGFIGTNTSQEIEALHKALEKVGLSATLGNDSQLELSYASGDRDKEELVKKILNTDTGKQRNLPDIMKELEELQMKVGHTSDNAANSPRSNKSSLEHQHHINVEDTRGFALSPAQPFTEQDYSHKGDYSAKGDYSSKADNSHKGADNSYYGGSSSHRGGESSYRGGFDTSHTEETEMYRPVIEVSVNERSRVKKKEQRKAEKNRRPEKDTLHKNTRHKDTLHRDTLHKDTLSRDTNRDTNTNGDTRRKGNSLNRSRSSSPLKIDFSETLKWKHKSIKGSGYGQPFSPPKPPRDKSRDREREILGYNRSKLGTARRRDTSREQSSSPARSPNKGAGNIKPDAGMVEVSPKKKEIHKTAEKAWSPKEVARQRVKGTQSSKQARLGSVASSQLEASVESFAKYIKDHFAGKTVEVLEAKFSPDEPALSASFKEKDFARSGEKDQIIASLKDELEQKQMSFERQFDILKLEYEHQIAELQQENFVLKAKVSGEGDEQVKKKVLAGEALEGVGKDQLEILKRELQEQETLITGYQQENKRLYEEMKTLKKQTKQTEERMFQENQKLMAEAANLRQNKLDKGRLVQLEKKEEQYQNKGLITGPAAQQKLASGDTKGTVAYLEAELAQAQRTGDVLSREMNVLQQSRVELEKHVEKLVMEREQLKKAIEESKNMKSEEARELEHQYQNEVEKLQNKLKWYAENQVLLDKGTRQLKQREDEIHKLKMRIEELQTESGKRVEDSKVLARERAADTKKIQDLQRQVKEMEAILKRRNPNSLPSLMIAAAAAGDPNPSNNRTAYTEVLESRVKKLEKELEGKDSETDTLMRSMEQKYLNVKVQYEERIKELETQLSIYQGQADHQHPHTHTVALERELESVRERYKQQVKDLQAEVDKLNADVAKTKRTAEASTKAELQSTKESELELRTLVKSLEMEVETKNHDLQVMQKSLERLRKEKQFSYSHLGKHAQSKSKGGNQKGDPFVDTELKSLPAQLANQKDYEPKTFEDAHISDVLKENEDLKMKVDRIHLQLEQQRVDSRKVMAENEALIRQTQEAYDEKLEQTRTSHQQEVKKLLAQQALEHSTSRTAELQSKVDTQEVMIKHLREQQTRLEIEAEAASVLRIKQKRLEETIKSLHKDLKEAKKSHTPEMRHFESLQDKIVEIENKYSAREKELQDIIRNSSQAASIEKETEVEKWRQLVETKNNEIQRFRVELDSILEVLRVLQKQGVVIPVASTAVS